MICLCISMAFTSCSSIHQTMCYMRSFAIVNSRVAFSKLIIVLCLTFLAYMPPRILLSLVAFYLWILVFFTRPHKVGLCYIT